MGDNGSAGNKQQGLQQAASVIFALVAVVPLLIFAYTLHTLNVIRSTQAQVSLGLALAIALLGFWMFRSMLGRMAEVVRALGAAVEQASRMRRPVSEAPVVAATAPTVPAAGPAAAATKVGNGAAPSPARAAAPPARATAPAKKAAVNHGGIPGVGNIREISEVARTMDVLWQREAAAHMGKRVQISVANSREPIVGTISEVSDDGLIIDEADGQTAVAYRRVTGIDRLTSQG